MRRVLDYQRLQRHVITKGVEIDLAEHPGAHALKLGDRAEGATDQGPLPSDRPEARQRLKVQHRVRRDLDREPLEPRQPTDRIEVDDRAIQHAQTPQWPSTVEEI